MTILRVSQWWCPTEKVSGATVPVVHLELIDLFDFFVRSCRREGRCNKSAIVSNFHLKDRRKGVKCTTIVIIVCNLDVKNVNHRVDFRKEISYIWNRNSVQFLVWCIINSRTNGGRLSESYHWKGVMSSSNTHDMFLSGKLELCFSLSLQLVRSDLCTRVNKIRRVRKVF